MTVTIIAIWAAAGWAIAAFLGGYLIGRARDRPKASASKVNERRESPAVCRTSPDPGAAEKSAREWQNFLSYDGSEQPVE